MLFVASNLRFAQTCTPYFPVLSVMFVASTSFYLYGTRTSTRRYVRGKVGDDEFQRDIRRSGERTVDLFCEKGFPIPSC